MDFAGGEGIMRDAFAPREAVPGFHLRDVVTVAARPGVPYGMFGFHLS